jgi:hypothetical protein
MVITVIASILTSKFKLRWPFVLVGVAMCTTGWAIELSQVDPPGVRYFALFLIGAGAFLQFPLLVSWLTGNLSDTTTKAYGTAIQQGFGNSCNFVSANVFITTQAPQYPVAFKTGLIISIIGGFACVLFVWLLDRENKALDKKEAETGVVLNAEGIRFRNHL